MGVIKKDGKYIIDYRHNGRRVRKRIGPNKAVADKVWAKIQVEIAENRHLNIKRQQKVRFSEFADKFYENYCIPNHKDPKRSAGNQLKCLKRYFGHKYLHEIKGTEIEQFKVERRKEVKPSSVNRALACLKNLYNRAIDWGDFEGANPVQKIKPFKEDNHRTRYLSKEEIKQLIPHCTDVIGKAVLIGLNCGLRRGEILNLKWTDIDFHERNIYILQSKSGKKRIIPINDFLLDVLISIPKNPYGPYVICHDDGKRFCDIRKAFKRILKKAGIEGFRFHDLRHSFASQLVMNGVDLTTVRELLGHADTRTTLRYSHLSHGHKQRAVNVLNQNMDNYWTKNTKEAQAKVFEESLNCCN